MTRWNAFTLVVIALSVLYCVAYYFWPVESVDVRNGSVFFYARFRGSPTFKFWVNASDLGLNLSYKRFRFTADNLPYAGLESSPVYAYFFNARISRSNGSVLFRVYPVRPDILREDLFFCRSLNLTIHGSSVAS